MATRDKSSESESDAKFLGWQKTQTGENIPLYNVTAENHPSYGSTVTGNTLNKLNLKTPDVPLSRGPGKNPDP